MPRVKKQLTPNYEIMLKGAITTLKVAYEDYKKAAIRTYTSTFIGDDGSFCTLGDPVKYQTEAEELFKRVCECIAEVEKIKKEMELQNLV